MTKALKITEIRKMFEDCANEHINDKVPFRAKTINEEVQKKLDFKLTMKIADFAETECSKQRTYGNKELFVNKVRDTI